METMNIRYILEEFHEKVERVGWYIFPKQGCSILNDNIYINSIGYNDTWRVEHQIWKRSIY